MRASLINSFAAVWLMLCLVTPLRSDPQRSWPDYPANQERTHPGIVSQLPPSIGRPHAMEYNYDPLYSTSGWISAKYELPEKSLQRDTKLPHAASQQTYYNYPNWGRDETRGAKDLSYQQLDEHRTGGLSDAELMEKMAILENILLDESKDVDTNAIDPSIPEETKRVVRQVRKQRPGFFWTLARVTFEAINDTRSAVKQISQLIQTNVQPDSATRRTMTSSSLMATTAPSRNVSGNLENVNGSETTTTAPTTTTEAPFVLTSGVLQSVIRRNILGLVRLFNIEWRDAVNQSQSNVRQFQKELGNQVGSFLQDNPDAY